MKFHDILVWRLALVVLTVLLLVPLLIADVPPLLDYPNHLARLALLAAGPDDPVLGRIFTPRWSIIPNLGGDVIGLPLVHLLPIHIAGRCLLGGILLLNLAGVLALHRAYFGRRSFWPLASVLVAYNGNFMLGFLNWQIGCGLAMLFAAAWLNWRDRRPMETIAGAAAAVVLLFFCHLMAVMFFLVLIGGAELRAMRDVRAMLMRSAGLLAVLIGPVVLWAFVTLRHAPAAAHWVSPSIKLVNAAAPFINYEFGLDMISAVLVFGGIGAGLAYGWLVLAPRAVVPVILLPILYWVLPFDFMSAAFIDMRVPVMFGFLIFAAVDPVRKPRLQLAGLAVLFVARMTVVVDVWTEHRRDLADLRAVIETVPPRATVYLTNVAPEEAPEYWNAGPRSRRFSSSLRADYHLPALLLIEHGAFWSVLLANPAQQPIALRPIYARMAREAHDMPPHDRLVADPDAALPALRDFDYVLMLEAGADPNLARFLPGCTVLVARTDFAALFQVLSDAPSCAPAARGKP